MMTRIATTLLLLAALASVGAASALAQQQPTPEQQNEFVPVDQLPPGEQMPAAPLLIAAYAVAWLALFFYLFSIWRRLQKVERELGDVARRITERSRT
jgi:CcmD family protein